MTESRPHDVPAGLGGYKIVRRIAVGGMAEVLLARQTVRQGIERLVVIKCILPGLSGDADLVSMFLSEARVAAQLQHANVVQIHDVTRLGTRPCIVMEYLQGLDTRKLGQRVRDTGQTLPIGIIAAIGEGAAHGLGYAHRVQGIDGSPLSVVHRDISPHNLFVTTDGAVKVLDFGIAKSSAQLQQTQEGTLKGKIAYMSPEQVRGEVLDGRSDLFALGAVLWELAVGRPLFGRSNEVETFAALMDGRIDPPSSLRPDIPEAFDRAVLGALSRDRAGRPASAEDLASALHAIAEAQCDGPPVLATARLVRVLVEQAPPSDPPGGVPSLRATQQGVGVPPAEGDRTVEMSTGDLEVAMTATFASSPAPIVAPAVARAVPEAPVALPLAIGSLQLEGLDAPGREEELPTKPRGPRPGAERVVVQSLDPTAPMDREPDGPDAPLEVEAPKPRAPSSVPAAPPPVVGPDVRDRFDMDGEDMGVAERGSPKIGLAVDLDQERRVMGRPVRDLDRRAALAADFGEPPMMLLTPLYALRVLRRRAALARRAVRLRSEIPILEAEARQVEAAAGRAVYEGAHDHRIAREAGAVEVAVHGLEEAEGMEGAKGAKGVAVERRKLDAELGVEERLAALGHAAISRVAGQSVTAPHEAKVRAAALRLEEARAELDVCERGRGMYDVGALNSGIALSLVIVATAATLFAAAFMGP